MWLTINRNRIKMEWWAALACLILAVDAGSFASRLLPSVPAKVWGEARKQTLNMIGGQLARGRSFTVEPWAAWWRHISYVSFEGDYEHLQRLMGSLTPNLTSELGFLQADAYEPMIMQRSNSIVNAARKAFQGGDRRADPLLDNLCVGSLIYTSLDWLAWVQNRDLVLPRAGVPQEVIPAKDYKQAVNLMESQFFDIHQAAIIEGASNYELGSGTANLVLDSPSRVDLEVKLAQPSWVILRDAAAPGWQAFIDGKPTRWYCADIMFRAVRVGEGEHQVSFSYRPACYIFGLYCALIGIVIVAGVTGFSISKRFNTSF